MELKFKSLFKATKFIWMEKLMKMKLKDVIEILLENADKILKTNTRLYLMMINKK
jgi:hypothetical protein